jgi:Na+-transporting methylmalonyl-CoA/oxaloacetate decarboxylase gamma subunit
MPTATTAITTDVAALSLSTLKANSRLNLAARTLLMLFSLTTAALAVAYVVTRAEAAVAILQQPGGETVPRLLALGAPMLLLGALAILGGIAAAVIHSRSLDESVRTLDSINRLRREGEVAVSARGLVVAFEEQLATIRRSHGLLLWLGRTLFVISLGLFTVAAISALWRGVDIWTLGMGVSSLGGAMWTAASRVPSNVAHDAANVVQVQLIVTAAHRQISLLESDAFAALNAKETDVETAHAVALDNQERIARVMAAAIEHVETYTDPKPAKVADVVALRRAA